MHIRLMLLAWLAPVMAVALDAPVENETISGRIVAVDQACRTVTLNATDGVHTLPIYGDTRVDLEGVRQDGLKDVHPGQVATVFFRTTHQPIWVVVTKLP